MDGANLLKPWRTHISRISSSVDTKSFSTELVGMVRRGTDLGPEGRIQFGGGDSVRQPHRELVYEAADRFVKAALGSDESLFTPGRPIWSAERAQDVYERFNLQPDETDRTFEQKLRDQLSGAPPETYQLFAECIFVCYLMPSDIKGSTKRRLIHLVLSWSPETVEIPEDLSEALDMGLAASSLAYKTLRPFQLWFLVEFARKWKGLPPDERGAALADPWKFQDLLHTTPIDKGYAQREALKHLVFPEAFENIVSREHKKAIAGAFADLVTEQNDNVDR